MFKMTARHRRDFPSTPAVNSRRGRYLRLASACWLTAASVACQSVTPAKQTPPGTSAPCSSTQSPHFISGAVDAWDLGFRPDATGVENQQALQKALDQGGSIVVTRPGTYPLAGTVYIGSETSLSFGAGVMIKKVAERGPFSHVILNKGARTKTWDHNIRVDGLEVIVNGVDARTFADVFGLHGQLAFFYARDVRITRFRCRDLGRWQYGIHVCTFEDLLVQDVIIYGAKDGVHLGRGKRFTIRDGVFGTGDDAVALNAHDYDVGNPELGWIENGLVENCHDLNVGPPIGYFCRILAGAWRDWSAGMEVQKSDTVVHGGRLYRVSADPDRKIYRSLTPPTHTTGRAVIDGICWQMVQEDVTYTAGVRNVTFRNIILEKPRHGFSIHFDADRFSRSFYPGSTMPRQENVTIENVTTLYEQPKDFLQVNTPIDTVTIAHSTLRGNRLHFRGHEAAATFGMTHINMLGCIFKQADAYELLKIDQPGPRVDLNVANSIVQNPSMLAHVTVPAPDSCHLRVDLPGLCTDKR